MSLFMRERRHISFAGLALATLFLVGRASAQDDDMTFGALDVEVKSVERESYETAVKKTKTGQCDSALFDFWDLLHNDKAKEFHSGSKYYIAKCLYRQGMYHAALFRFAKILEQGEQSEYFQTSREWLFFISRKIEDQEAVLDTIAKYSNKGGVPDKYADEFHYLLAKYYYLKGIGDLVPDPDAGRASEAEQRKKEDEKKREEEGGFDFGAGALEGGGGDLMVPGSGGDFDFSLDDINDKPKPKKRRRHRRKPKPKPKHEVSLPDDKPVDDTASSADDGMDFSIGDEGGSGPAKERSYKTGGMAPGEAMEKSLEHLEQVSKDSQYFARATYIKGLVHYQREQYEEAVSAFRSVVRLTKPNGGSYHSPKLRQMAFFSLARVHYGFKQFRYAIFYYDKISRDSEAWLDALFESSWAYFRLGNYEKSLGNLITLHSPFFVDEYYPESLILKAVTYYENCRYPEAKQILVDFEDHYGGVRDELVKITKEAQSPEDYYKLIDEFSKRPPNETNRLTLQLVRLALSDKGIKALDKAVAELSAEEELMRTELTGLVGTELGKDIQASLDRRRTEVMTRAGRLIGDKLAAERDDLKSLSSQLFRIKFEIAKMEKEQIEAEMRGDSLVVPLSEYRFSAAVDDEHEFYPFGGEYWRDELGTYEYTLTQGCRPETND